MAALSPPQIHHRVDVGRLIRYFSLAADKQVGIDLARTLLATAAGDQLDELGPAELELLRPALRIFAGAMLRWMTIYPELPITDLIRVVPRLRHILGDDDWVIREPAGKILLERYEKGKRAFRRVDVSDVCPWSLTAKRMALVKLVLDALTKGKGYALCQFLKEIVLIGSFFPFSVPPEELVSAFDDGGWYAELGASKFAALSRELQNQASLASTTAVQHVFLLLNFTSAGSAAHNARLNDSVVMPWARRMFEIGAVEPACVAVHWSLLFHGYRLTSENEFARWVDGFAYESTKAGQRLRKCAPPVLHWDGQAPLRIAFITRGGSVSSAAADHVLRIMEQLAAQHDKACTATLYVFGEYHPDLEKNCQTRGLNVRFIVDEGFLEDRISSRLIRLAQVVEEDGIDVAVWTHAFDFVYFAFGLRMAPIQVLFSQYLHPMPSGVEVDAFLTWGSPVLTKQRFGHVDWTVIPSALRFPHYSDKSGEVVRLRGLFGGGDHIIAGTLGRAEKVAQPDYLDTVSALLRKYPQLIFLWTGHSEHSDVRNAFEAAGVISQVKFVGWVDVPTYARVLDICLDSFPLSNGITALQCMEAGTPILSFASPLSFAGRDVAPAYEGAKSETASQVRLAAKLRGLFGVNSRDIPAAVDACDYLVKASQLIEDGTRRAHWGRSWKSVYDLLYADEQQMAQTFVDRITGIALQRRSVSSNNTMLGEGAAEDSSSLV